MNEPLRVPDQAERLRALDVRRSFIVQAPAGSGKTELLTQRFLALLAVAEHPEEIVAITFTRKAAAEMRARIVDALERARGPAPDEAHARQSWELASRALARDAAQGWKLTESPNRLRVTTIDAFCAALTRQMPLLSRFGAQPATCTRPEPHYRRAARATLAALESDADWAGPLELLLSHLGNNLVYLEELLIAILGRRDQWLRHVGAADTEALREALGRGFERLTREALAEALDAMPPGARAELPALAAYAAANVGPEKSGLRACLDLERLSAEPEALPVWLGLAELLLKVDGDLRGQVTASDGFPPKAKGAEGELRGAMKERMTALLKNLAGETRLIAALRRLRELPPPGYADSRWPLVDALVRVLRLAAAQLRLTFQEAGEVDFSEISQAAVAALGDEGEPTDLALRLDYRIRHLLLDEFQDTSVSQRALLEKLTAGWEPGDGRTLFAVGDPMQSIYRFREAEVGIYVTVRRDGIGSVELEPLQLTANFRSQPALVGWVNDCFGRLMPTVEDIARGAVPHAQAIPMRSDLGGEGVRWFPFVGDAREAEAARVVELVREALARGDGSVAVLVRARTHLASVSRALRAAGIGFQAVEIEGLAQRPAVQDLLALTRALVHPADRLAWLAVLRAPWCGLTLHDLHALVAGAPTAPVWELMRDESRLATLSSEGAARLARVRSVLATALERRRRGGLARWVEGAWLALGGPAAADSEAELADAETVLTLLASLEEGGGLTDLDRLDDEIARLYARPDAGETPVQVMTLHKAKGLEFDTVILPGLGRKPPNADSPLLRWLELPAREGGGDLLLAPIHGSGQEKDPGYRCLAGLEREKEDFEAVRLLYVAATRAKRQLYLLGEAKATKGGVRPEARSLLSYLWPVAREHFEAVAETAEAEPAGASVPASPLRRVPLGWRPPAPPSPIPFRPGAEPVADLEAPEFSWAGETLRHVGTVVHRMLQRIAEEGLARWDGDVVARQLPLFRALLKGLGVPPEELEPAAADVRAALTGALADARGRWILQPHEQARCEYALTGLIDGRRVSVSIDRTFVSDGERWIIDYKTGRHAGQDREAFLDREAGRYRPQLERYAALLSELDPRPIRLGLYFPLLGAWRELTYTPSDGASLPCP